MSLQTSYMCDQCEKTGTGDGWLHIRRVDVPTNHAVYRPPYDKHFCNTRCAVDALTLPPGLRFTPASETTRTARLNAPAYYETHPNG